MPFQYRLVAYNIMPSAMTNIVIQTSVVNPCHIVMSNCNASVSMFGKIEYMAGDNIYFPIIFVIKNTVTIIIHYFIRDKSIQFDALHSYSINWYRRYE